MLDEKSYTTYEFDKIFQFLTEANVEVLLLSTNYIT
jgi:hypothetical protein